ncbi:MAG: diacylglycerol kinase family protein [Chitinophagaceae bacterium]
MAKSPLLRSFGYAFKGFKAAYSERNFKLHLVSATLTIIMGFIAQLTMVQWCIILICIAGVLTLELVNTAIEHLVNLVSPEFNETAGKVKDISAAAVLCFSIASFIIALMIFVPRLYALYFNPVQACQG